MESEPERHEQGAADDDEERAHREGCGEVLVELLVDRERQSLRYALEAPREHDRGPELPEPPRKREGFSRRQPAAGERKDDAEERLHRAGAERPRRRDQVRVDGLERRDRLADVERARDEGDGDDDRRLCQAEPDAERIERPAEQPEAAEGRDEPDAGDRRRQDERQLYEHDRDRASSKAAGREQIRRGRPEEEHECLRDCTRLEADDERIRHDRARELRDEPPRRDASEDRDDRDEQEGERNGRGGKDAETGEPAPDQRGIGRKPAVRSFFCAGFRRSRLTHALAAFRCSLDFTAAAA